MAKVEIRVKRSGDYGQYAEVEVEVDGVTIGGGLAGGGEPEDNTIERDYAWIVPTMKALAEKLGATVETSETESEDA